MAEVSPWGQMWESDLAHPWSEQASEEAKMMGKRMAEKIAWENSRATVMAPESLGWASGTRMVKI